jgi:dolichol-phosphate mannosyltransferase
MVSISLIIPHSLGRTKANFDIEAYRRVLRQQAGVSSVEVIHAGKFDGLDEDLKRDSGVLLAAADEGRVKRLRVGMEAASGDVIIVIDPERPYPPAALLELLQGLNASDAEMAIAVPGRNGSESAWSLLRRSSVGLASLLSFGTSDVFSGLVAFRRAPHSSVASSRGSYGSRLVLELLTWPHDAHVDVPVCTYPDDRFRVGAIRLDDVRQLKRVLDRRFGTFSRLVQFCIVGASGMIVDLTLYALFQLVFTHLATAGALSIFVALMWNFTLNRRLTFNDSRGGSIPRQFLTYALGNALGIAVSLSLRLYLPLHIGFFARHRLAAAVVGIVVATGISFSMSRWVIFIRRPDGRPKPEQPHLAVDSGL